MSQNDDAERRALAEQRLERVVGALKAARVATFFWDENTSTVTWDDESRLAFPGVSGAEFDSDIRSVLECIHSQDRARVGAAFQRAFEGGGVERLTCRARELSDPRAAEVWMEVSASGAGEGRAHEKTLMGTFVDVTPHKLLERQLVEARETLELALSAGGIGTQVWDFRARTHEVHGAWDQIFGCSSRDLNRLGYRAFASNLDVRHRPMAAEILADAMERALPTKWTYRYQRPDGSWVWVASRTITECDAEGKPWRVIAAIADVSELQRAEERLRTQSTVNETLARNDTTAQAMHNALATVCCCEELDFGGFWALDRSTERLSCTALFVAPGVSAPHVKGMILAQQYARGEGIPGRALTPQPSAEAPALEVDALSELAFDFNLNHCLARPVYADHECMGVLVFLNRKPIADDPDMARFIDFVGVQLALFVQRRQAEQALRTLNAELEERVRARTAELEASNRELESFSYSVSHDLRAPLRAMDGFSLACASDYGDLLPAEGLRQLAAVRDGARQMGNLIDDLLNFSRLSRAPIRKRAFATDELVRECLGMLAGMQQGRALDIAIGDLPTSEGDRALIKQVWVNLLSNALKYTGKCAQACVWVDAQTVDGNTTFRVRDNGAGFDMRYAHKLFGVFKRLHRAEDYEGTGVGLAICQRIVQRHGGRIWADAKPGAGATFAFTLPAAATEGPEAKAQ